jgi:hypothetical protein
MHSSKTTSAADELRVDGQESSKDVLVKRDRLPARVRNQLGRAKVPLASCSKAGWRLTENRSFTDSILNNTPPTQGSDDSSQFNPVSLEIHFCGRREKVDLVST